MQRAESWFRGCSSILTGKALSIMSVHGASAWDPVLPVSHAAELLPICSKTARLSNLIARMRRALILQWLGRHHYGTVNLVLNWRVLDYTKPADCIAPANLSRQPLAIISASIFSLLLMPLSTWEMPCCRQAFQQSVSLDRAPGIANWYLARREVSYMRVYIQICPTIIHTGFASHPTAPAIDIIEISGESFSPQWCHLYRHQAHAKGLPNFQMTVTIFVVAGHIRWF